MTVINNAKLIRRELLSRLCQILLEKKELKAVNRIPLEMRPRNGHHVRCCVHRDRAVIRYKILGMLGFDANNEEDELKMLSTCVEESLAGQTSTSEILNVVDEACSACRKNNYVVTNMCQACVGRPCEMNCPKDSISFHDKMAKIDPETCVNCGKCQQVCPFRAIIYSPVPCEDVCPVDAIQKDDNGKEKIDPDKCILCGKCMSACPFGAIVEKTELLNIIDRMDTEEKHVAMIAPAIAGQFRESMGKIVSSLKTLGFDEVYEVALGADMTSRNEAAEFKEKAEHGESMTTSCCPAYVNTIEKHAPELKPFVSTTLTPMRYTAQILRQEHPDAKLVFIGPCMGKKSEALRTPEVDHVLNFEEYGAWLIAAGIELSDCNELPLGDNITVQARNYANIGGVTAAVAAEVPDIDINSVVFDGIDKSFLRKLKTSLKAKTPTLVEVMSCEGGCVAGCNAIATPKAAKRQLDKFVNTMKKKTTTI